MTMPFAMLAIMVVLYAVGVYLLLDRSLTRVLLGFLLVGNATNLLIFLTSGSFGSAPIYGQADPSEMSDPLPQAFILTSIVITFAVSAFILALIYRAWRLQRDSEDEVQDELQDDEHDIAIATAEHLATEEVTDEDLALVPEFESDDSEEEDASPDPVSARETNEGAQK